MRSAPFFSATRLPRLTRKLFAGRAFHCVESTRGKREGMQRLCLFARVFASLSSLPLSASVLLHPFVSLHICASRRVCRVAWVASP